ncbi:hypothetical protein [Sodalis sp. dw_96]|uniref:hypothetical protein n=1 Tax=Sodalis sp. dw_96 TaxID=2719794 RepID=UPI001BD2411A|nr:hypothetical protein [Sodalis sp. dw_96]
MRLAEYFTCCPRQDFSDGNAWLRNWDWAPNYHGNWESWAEEAWFEEKRNRQVAKKKYFIVITIGRKNWTYPISACAACQYYPAR